MNRTRMMFIKHYAPNRCLCIKVAKSTIHVQLITGVRIAEMSQLQSCSVVCSKNGRSYCEKLSEAFVKIQKFKLNFFIFFWWEGGGGGGGGVRLGVGLGG